MRTGEKNGYRTVGLDRETERMRGLTRCVGSINKKDSGDHDFPHLQLLLDQPVLQPRRLRAVASLFAGG